MNDNSFSNPYLGLDPDDEETTARINVNVSREDYCFIRRIRPDGGTISATVNTLFKRLVNELKRLNITDWTRVHDFENYIATVRLISGRPAKKRRAAAKTHGPNDPRRTTRAHSQNAHPKNVGPDPSSRDATEGEGGEDKNTKG